MVRISPAIALVLTFLALASGGTLIDTPLGDTAKAANNTNITTTVLQSSDLLLVGAMFIGEGGRPLILFSDRGSSKVGYVRCGNESCSEGNTTRLLEVGVGTDFYSRPLPPQMHLDLQDRPVIAYVESHLIMDPTLTARERTRNELKMLRCADQDCSSFLDVTTIHEDTDAFSFDLDKDDNPVFAIMDRTKFGLRYIRCQDPSCSGHEETVDIPNRGSITEALDLTLDDRGLPVMATFPRMLPRVLRIDRCSDSTCKGAVSQTVVDKTVNGSDDVEIAIDEQGFPVVAYRNSDPVEIRLLRCGNPDCSAENHISIIASEVGHNFGLVLDSESHPVISIRQGSPVHLIRCNDHLCDGSISAIELDPQGYEPSHLVLDRHGNPIVAYSTRTNGLQVTHCATPTCAPSQSLGPGLGKIQPPATGDGGVVRSKCHVPWWSVKLNAPGLGLIRKDDLWNTVLPLGDREARNR
jgi:hypothetical protein